MNFIKRFFKQLFCDHHYKYIKNIKKIFHEDDFSGFGYNTWTETYEVYECIKCGNKKYKYINKYEK